jgi:hypothetical protein
VDALTLTGGRFIIKPPALGKHTFRRPGFLRVLNLSEYTEFYRHLEDQEYQLDGNVDSPETLTRAITAVGQPLSHLYRHILFWFRPDFEVPIGAQYSKLKSYDVQAEAEAAACTVPLLDVEAAMLEHDKTRAEVIDDHKRRKKNAQLNALNLERQLAEIVRDRKDVFDLPANTKASLHSSAIVDGHHSNRRRRRGRSESKSGPTWP